MTITTHKQNFLKSAIGAMLTVFCGLLLWKTPPGEPWVNASYDYLFRFGSRAITNRVVVILMDNEAYDQFNQVRGQPWDRALHAQLLQRLAQDGCSLVVFDSLFRAPRDSAKDQALIDAIQLQKHTVLMAEQAQVTHPMLTGAQPTLPSKMFLNEATTSWGVAWLDPDLDLTVHRHWPFPAPGPYPSLPWAAAQIAGARLDDSPHEQWLRYYGRDGAWTRLSYRFALTQPVNYFRDRIVFIGSQPMTSLPDGEVDEFRVPYTRWTGESCGGVEIMATAFLNLMNHDWLERPAKWAEALILTVTGALLGGLLCRLRRPAACVAAVAVALAVSLGAVSWSYYTDHWFPWLVIAAGQVPCALVWALARPGVPANDAASKAVTTVESFFRPEPAAAELPDTPDYELINPPFGQGSYGKVWLARNAVGQWQALKVVYQANFGENPHPYEREFNGIRRYKPVSDKHPGLLRVDFVSRQRAGYFYYVMELGDSLDPGWETDPTKYRPRDLHSERARAPGRRLPVPECVQIGIELTEALDFLHQQGLTHRDIKPQNIIFLNGHPKLADVGLIAELRPSSQERTLVGTPGYMPPAPERPGTPQADIYALGMVLYVLSTGRNAPLFPEIATTLVEEENPADFFLLNSIILKACHPDSAKRFVSAAEMLEALRKVQTSLSKP